MSHPDQAMEDSMRLRKPLMTVSMAVLSLAVAIGCFAQAV